MKLESTQRRAEMAKGIGLSTSIAAILLFLRFAPTGAERFYPRCVFTAITKIYCPGCGMMRALKSLACFDFANAFFYNPFLFIIIIPLFIYMTATYLTRAITGKWIPSLLSSPRSVLPVAAVIVAIWIFRNVFPLGL
ncbi:MAG: DUF2752 domain-containing protein [Chitinispirillales bacterium]|jgi:hypothetical protein|nr:DUF2752 domain-containing protein [Chitinispirillales bacterium]